MLRGARESRQRLVQIEAARQAKIFDAASNGVAAQSRPLWMKATACVMAVVTYLLPGVLTLDHNGLMVEAASDGLGLAYVPESTARDWLDDGRLVAVLEDWCPFIPGLCLYYPGHRHVPAGLRAFIDVLREVNH